MMKSLAAQKNIIENKNTSVEASGIPGVYAVTQE
jgi:hypothetical protein